MIKVASGISIKTAGDFGTDDAGRVIQALPVRLDAPKVPHWTDPSPEFLFRQQAVKARAKLKADSLVGAGAQTGILSGLATTIRKLLGKKG